jgi:multidrug efflux pump subunit AcrA (membrane-fusion protein)
MNRETSIHSSDTLVVVDSSRRRRRMLIVGALAALALFVLGLAVIMGKSASDKPAGGAAAGKAAAGQAPSVTVVVPGLSQVGRTVTASGPLSARRDQPVGIAGQGGRVVRVLVDAGSWVHAGQVLAVVDRSVQAQQAAQLTAQIEAAKAQAALAQAFRHGRRSGPAARAGRASPSRRPWRSGTAIPSRG